MATALLVDEAGSIYGRLIRVLRRVFSAHFVLARCILIRRGILQAGRVLEGALGHVTLEERVALLDRAETSVDGSLDNVLRLLGVRVVVLRSRIFHRVQVGV